MAASPERHRGFLRRAPRDSQDSFISSPLAGSQAAMSATVWLRFQCAFHSGMWDARAVTLASLVSRISTREPRVPEWLAKLLLTYFSPKELIETYSVKIG